MTDRSSVDFLRQLKLASPIKIAKCGSRIGIDQQAIRRWLRTIFFREPQQVSITSNYSDIASSQVNKLTFDTNNGRLQINNTIIAPVAQEAFSQICEKEILAIKKRVPSPGRVNFGLPVEMAGKRFGLVLSYDNDNLESAWMTWLDGSSASKGYDTTEKDLFVDFGKLRTFVIKHLGRDPDEETFNHLVFRYPWGQCSCNASLQMQCVGIGIRWF